MKTNKREFSPKPHTLNPKPKHLCLLLVLAISLTISCESDEYGDSGDGDGTNSSSSSGGGGGSGGSSSSSDCNANSGGYSGEYGSLEYEGQTYKTVVIGTQTWFAENLNYNVDGSVCYYNDPSNCTKYGRLYNWSTAMTVCPSGWHLPTNEDWDKLFRYVDGNTETSSPYKSSIAGRYLKAICGWNNDDGTSGNGEDTHGFAALPGGYGGSGGSFYAVGNVGNWWSASEYSASLAYGRGMGYSFEDAIYNDNYKSNLFSVRCIKDVRQ